ncbi:MAG TPA: hypothetical protein VGD42_07860 [Lysobacter sp.]
MNAPRIAIALLLAATAFPLAAMQAQPAHRAPPGANAPVAAADTAPAVAEDRWSAADPAAAARAVVVDTTSDAPANDAAFDTARKRPALTFADQQPLKPNLFDSPTAWEDEP